MYDGNHYGSDFQTIFPSWQHIVISFSKTRETLAYYCKFAKNRYIGTGKHIRREYAHQRVLLETLHYGISCV